MPNWFFLSERGLERERSHIAYGVNYEFEDLLLRMTQGTLIAPQNSNAFCRARSILRVGRGAGWLVGNTVGRYRPVEISRDATGPRILFVTGMGSRSLRLLSAIPNWRKAFDIVVAFVLDAFEPYPLEEARQLDHLFVIIPELVDGLKRSLGIPVSFMPLACDVLDKGSGRLNRGIDILAYGRQWQVYADELDHHFLSAESKRLYLTSFSHPKAPDWRQQRKQFWSVLARAHISLAFAPDVTQTRFQGLPVISARWYEGLAAGCVMVGKKPHSPVFDELFNWKDAVIELPDSPTAAPEVIDSLLDQPERLAQAHLRNYLMMLRHHDARHIFARICNHVEVDLPASAGLELERVRTHMESAERSCLDIGIDDVSDDQPKALPYPRISRAN